MLTIEAFKALLANRKSGELRGEELANAWLSHPERRQFRDFTFRPSGDGDPSLLNLWRGFAVDPQLENVRPALDFILEVICNHDVELYQWVIAWMAQLVQEPDQKPGTAIIMLGPQGTGKSTFAEILMALLGPHAISVNSADRLTRPFNFHLKDKCMVVVEEAPLLRRHANVMKDLITNRRMMVEPKGVDAFDMENHVRIVVCTNELNALHAQAHERRYCVIRVSDERQEDHAYFAKLRRWMQNGGIPALLHFLQRHNFFGVELRQVPRTKALLEQKENSFPWWSGLSTKH